MHDRYLPDVEGTPCSCAGHTQILRLGELEIAVTENGNGGAVVKASKGKPLSPADLAVLERTWAALR